MSSSLHRVEGGSWGAFRENSFKVLGIQKSFGDAGSPNADVPLTLDKAASQTSTSPPGSGFSRRTPDRQGNGPNCKDQLTCSLLCEEPQLDQLCTTRPGQFECYATHKKLFKRKLKIQVANS